MFNFEEERQRTRKKIMKIFWIIVTVMVVMVVGHIAAGYWIYNQVQDNGGVKETLVDVVKTIKQIDKESDVK